MPDAPGALLLLLTLRSVDASDNHLDIGAGDPAVRILFTPDCGCDACDSGSDGLLEEIDENVLSIVSGDLVHVVLPDGTTVVGRSDGWSATGGKPGRIADHAAVKSAIDDVRAGRWNGAALHGRPRW